MKSATQKEIEEFHKLKVKYGTFQEIIAFKLFAVDKRFFKGLCEKWKVTPSKFIRELISEINHNKEFRKKLIKKLKKKLK